VSQQREPHSLLAAAEALPAAVEFLTPVRLHSGAEFPDFAIGSSSAFFPVVGILLGLVLLGVDRLLGRALPSATLNALLVVVLTLATGALHLDGLADTLDGLAGGATRDRRLEIMRDSRIGAFGAAGLVLVLLLQWALLVDLVSPWRRPALLLFPTLGRGAMAAAIAAFPYARSSGLGTLFRLHIWPWQAPLALIISLGLAGACFGVSGVALWGAMLLCALGVGFLLTSKLGGLTGDCYGAICEITQLAILTLIVSAHALGWLLPWLIRG
jgi:adenosylcobinamide-GDP ribazoletransferase